jgi:hypothetical protein
MQHLVVAAGLRVPAYDRLKKESFRRLVPTGQLFARPVHWSGYDPDQAQSYTQTV